MINKSLHITVAATPTDFDNDIQRLLIKDLQMTKAAILYGDTVDLFSPTVSFFDTLLTSIAVPPNSPGEKRAFLEVFLTADEHLDRSNEPLFDEVAIRTYETLSSRPLDQLSDLDLSTIAHHEELLNHAWEALSSSLKSTSHFARWAELREAREKGVLSVHSFREQKRASDSQVEFAAQVGQVLRRRDTNPMFDKWTADLVRLAIEAARDGKVQLPFALGEKSSSVESGIVASLFERLPVVDIPMDELLDLRKDLARSLVGFRSEISRLAESVEHATWDSDTPHDIDNIVQQKIAPAIIELEDRLDALKLAKALPRRITEKAGTLIPGLAAGATIGACVSPMIGILTAVATVTANVLGTLAEIEEQYRSIERNSLYFYYQVDKYAENRRRKRKKKPRWK